MQTQPHQLLRQQMILKELGYYTGPLDGVWGPQSIEAMRRFENRVSDFRPARQTGGLPFSAESRLPKGMWWEKELLCNDKISEITAEEEQLREAAVKYRGRTKREGDGKQQPVLDAPAAEPAQGRILEEPPAKQQNMPKNINNQLPKKQSGAD